MEALDLEKGVARADELHGVARPRVRQRKDARVRQVGTARHEDPH